MFYFIAVINKQVWEMKKRTDILIPVPSAVLTNFQCAKQKHIKFVFPLFTIVFKITLNIVCTSE